MKPVTEAAATGGGRLSPDLVSYLGRSRGTGRPLESGIRAGMETSFGAGLEGVRVHTGPEPAAAARSINARAFTLGQDIWFGAGEYRPETTPGTFLLAHELAHTLSQAQVGPLESVRLGSPGDPAEAAADSAAAATVHGLTTRHQPGSDDVMRRSVVEYAPGPAHSTGGEEQAYLPRIEGPVESPSASRPGRVPPPETCPPPAELDCSPADSSPAAVSHTILFAQNSATLDAAAKAQVDAAAAEWHTAGGAIVMRIDGYASAEGACDYNWGLSCRRARAVLAELQAPSDGTAPVPGGSLEIFGNGETDIGGPALAPNRMATISIPSAPPPPPQPPPQSCRFPIVLGSARGCGSGADFAHYDFPSITAASTARLAAWAGARPMSRGPFRSLVTNAECEVEMAAVLTGLAGTEGFNAFARFARGTGGTSTHGPASVLGAMALISPSFLSTVSAVASDIETQLAAQAASGGLDACALAVTPPPTFFDFGDGVALKAVIGGTQGETLLATGFTANIPTRTYSIDLKFIICDDFGVDESDLYFHGLYAFWVLQHERSPTLYRPFINELKLPITVSGTF